MRDSLRERSLSFRYPVTHRAGCDRKRGSFSQPEHYTRNKDCCEAADQPRAQCGSPPDNRSDGEHPPRTEPVTQPSAKDRENYVGICESRKHKSDLRIAEVKVLLKHRSSGTHVHPVDVRDA